MANYTLLQLPQANPPEPRRSVRRGGPACAPACLFLVLMLVSPLVLAQSKEADRSGTQDAPSPETMAIPDAAGDWLERWSETEDVFSIKAGISLLSDYTSFDQDQASIDQVGNQHDQFQARSVRFMLRGDFKLGGDWSYQFSTEYKGFGSHPDGLWQETDVWVARHIGRGKLTVGKQKEPFIYEMVGDAANLPQNERLLSPFFVSRNTGITYSNTTPSGRGLMTVGWFNDSLASSVSRDDAGDDFAARFTTVPVLSEDGRRYLHVGIAGRYQDEKGGTLRYRGKPESNVADNYVDTGNIPANSAKSAAVEVLWADRYYSVLFEDVRTWVDSPQTGDPTFNGRYVTVSFTPLGWPREYDPKVGYARRVPMTSRWGAPEVVLRYGHLDLDDGLVEGGTMDKWFVGVNWWATKRWKASIGYGNTDLDRFGETGNTRSLLTRLQWIY